MHTVSDLRITAIQTDLLWEDPAANRLHLMNLLGNISPGSADVIVLPEMFTTGFSMQPERIAEPFSDRMDTLRWMRNWAEKTDAAVTGSVAVAENGCYYNRLLWVRPDGTYSHYDKRHLFRMASEHQHYRAGEQLSGKYFPCCMMRTTSGCSRNP
jgi:omega-amidase